MRTLAIMVAGLTALLGSSVLAETFVETGAIFVVGAVRSPGRYAWEPGLTAMKAYALAGGAPRNLDAGNGLLLFEGYRAIEQEQQAVVQLAGSLLRQERLTAEAASAPSFVPPSGWAAGLAPENAAELRDSEMALFKSRQTALEGELAIIERQRAVLTEQLNAFRAGLENKTQQVALLREELKAIDTPGAERIVPVPRLLGLRRSILEAEGDERDIERRITETRIQGVSMEQSALNLRNARMIEVSTLLAEVERSLITLRKGAALAKQRADAARLIISLFPPRVLSRTEHNSGSDDSPPKFTIRRGTEGETRTLEADEDTELLPRDLLVVQ